MFNYLQKFNSLSKELRDKVSSPLVMENINSLEKEYGIDLAIIVMKIMTKDILFTDLNHYLNTDLKLSESLSLELVDKLQDKVFKDVKIHLGILEKPVEVRKFSDFDPSFPDRQTRSNGGKVRGDDYIFSPEDEEEIRALTKKINGYSEIKKNVDTKKNVDAIVNEIDINFGSSYLEQRFRDIVSTYLRGIRDRIDTRFALGKSFNEGGLGFDVDSVDKAFGIIDKYFGEKIDESLKLKPKLSLPNEESQAPNKKIDILKNVGARDVDYNLRKVLEEKELAKKTSQEENRNKESEPVKQKDVKISSVKVMVGKPSFAEATADKKDFLNIKKLDLEHELAPPPPRIVEKEQKKGKIKINNIIVESQEKQQDKLSPSSPMIKKPDSFNILRKKKIKVDREDSLFEKNIKQRTNSKSNIPTGLSGKKIMKDVSVVPRVMSPIDELKFMDLITFRRLSQNINEITEKINNKIKLLEEDQYSKRIEGIRAWRNSPVNRLYLAIGEESISKNKSINAIIEDRKSQNKDYLTNEEFEAVMDLNKNLRF